ncbi:MAG: hypothetical protein M3N93_01510 [Acidobacteriota bacterium]|nr:hypothetical protein [Acidobacteriota bacterium]
MMIGLIKAFGFLRNVKLATVTYAIKRPVAGNIARMIHGSLISLILHFSTVVLFMTKQQIEEAAAQFPERAQKFKFLRVGVDTRFFAPTEAGEYDSGSSPPYVVVAGDNLRDEEFIRDTMQGSDLTLIRLTQNRFVEEFWARASASGSLNFAVSCKAHLPWNKVREIYQHASAVLCFSDSSWHPAGWTVFTEALACGKHVVINSGLVATEAQRYQSAGGQAFIEVKNLNLETAANALHSVIARAHEVGPINQQARDFAVQHLTLSHSTNDLTAVFEEMFK